MSYIIERASAGKAEYTSDEAGNDLPAQLQKIILFMRDEIEQSKEMLSKLVGDLNSEVCTLDQTGPEDEVLASLNRMSETLQAEDRIQQRLSDICSTLAVVEQAIDPAGEDQSDELPLRVIGQLKLTEMQTALAIMADIGDGLIVPEPAPVPCLGDVDLF